jgi:N-methylhydantoinase B
MSVVGAIAAPQEQREADMTEMPRAPVNAAAARGGPLDAITLSVTQNRLDHISQQMGFVMVRTARSPIFSQSHDFSCFLAGPDGTVIAQADGIPIHTGSGGFAVEAILREAKRDGIDGIRPGDVFVLNDPYVAGGNHLPDWVIARPAFAQGRLVGFACNRAHQSDIGGGAAGTYNSAATEIWHEGIRLPVLRLIEQGRVREDLWKLLLINSRTPEALDGDLRAMIGSARIGAEGIEAIAAELGTGQALAVFEGILAHAEEQQRAAFRALPPGTYLGEDRSDTDCFETRDVWVRVAVTVREDGEAVIDFAGTSDQIRGFKNSSLANTYSAVFVALTSFFDPALPRNGGRFRAVRIVVPEGSLLNPHPPAPVTMCTVFPAHDVIHAVWKALGQADAKRASAGWAKNVFGVTAGNSARRGPYVLYHANAAGGGGAVEGRDGFNSIGHLCTLGGFTLPNVEVYERAFPVRFLAQEFRTDSAGAGQFRGGTGVHYAVNVEEPASYSFRGEGLNYVSSYGIAGGSAGAEGRMLLRYEDGREEAAPKFGVRQLPPLTLEAWSPGGGGWGDPKQRDRAAVERDVRDGVVSAEAAREVYGA